MLDSSTVCPVDSRQVVRWDRSSVETGRPSRRLDGWTSRPFSWDKSTYRECCFRPLKIFCQNAKRLAAIEYRSSESSLKDNKVLSGWQWWPLLGCRLVRRLGQMRSRERANDNNAQLISVNQRVYKSAFSLVLFEIFRDWQAFSQSSQFISINNSVKK